MNVLIESACIMVGAFVGDLAGVGIRRLFRERASTTALRLSEIEERVEELEDAVFAEGGDPDPPDEAPLEEEPPKDVVQLRRVV